MGGDFNLVLDHILEWNFPAYSYTFYSSPYSTLSRLDFFLISNLVTTSAASSTIGNILISYHAPVLLSMLPFNKTVRSPRWRLNSSLLLDLDFKESLRTQINLYKITKWPSALT